MGTDPDVRLSLANARTFRAWNRTALALIGGGLAVAQLLPPFDLPGERQVIGLPLVALGSLVSMWSYREWAATKRPCASGARRRLACRRRWR